MATAFKTYHHERLEKHEKKLLCNFFDIINLNFLVVLVVEKLFFGKPQKLKKLNAVAVVLSTQYSILNTQYSILSTQY